jgi:signal transduction histidine kinase
LTRSVRSRVLLGSILWTLGLLAATHLLSLALMHHFPTIRFVAHGSEIAVFALVLMIVGLLLLRSGVSPLKELRARFAALSAGREQRVEGNYPSEVQPLVNDLNALLDHREEVVHRAMSKAGDLAHGLKTPLAVLYQEAERAAASGHAELAATITQQVDRMRRQVEYHLAQARAAGSGAAPGARCSVLASAEGLARTLLRLHAERGLTIDVNVAADHIVRVEREDLDEMLGNLLDNACQWARSRVRVESSSGDATIVISVDDDGPGLDPSLRDVVLQRGVRADEAAPGSGLGLAIVRDLAALYGGSISLSSAPIGGLRAQLRVPAG